jgi:aspartate-semialdehyde dehydrogenase
MKKIGILGASGAVGEQLIQLIQDRKFQYSELRLFNSRSAPVFEGLDLLFSCVSSSLAKEYLPQAVNKGVLCIDASSYFRKEAPLIIPEINAHALESHKGIVASPNCTTTLMLLPLFPLHQRFKIKRIIATTFQAVSGVGAKGIFELETQAKAHLEGKEIPPSVFPVPCAFNVFPHEGHGEEEEKMRTETLKILEDSTIKVCAQCFRVPVFRAHSEALNVEFRLPFTLEEALAILTQSPGIKFKQWPSAVDASGKMEVFYGRLGKDLSNPNTLEMWVVGDQLLKGAALNMIQIAERW